MPADVDVAIVGSGFAGALLALVARRLGLRVILVERGRHPRFAIGESASPLAGVLIEQLADRYDLPRIRPLACYGAWRRVYPDVTCGLKRGFTFYKHLAGRRYLAAPDRSNQLLVAASPSAEVADTHWLRADVDHFLVREAIAGGVDYTDETSLDAIEWHADGGATLTGTRRAQPVRVRANLVVDATGPRGFLHRVLQSRDRGFRGYPATQALYTHFTDVARCQDLPEYSCSELPPYPIDAAALHHAFDEGWMWVLRFDNGVTSAGVAVTDAFAADLRLADGEAAWHRLLARYPSIAAQFADARPIREFTWMPRVAFRADDAAGGGWAMLPSAAAFVDPLFSTGIPLALLGIERIARMLERGIERGRICPDRVYLDGAGLNGLGADGVGPAGADRDSQAWSDYSRTTLAEADHTARFIAGCYAAFPRFEDFTAYSMFYFAAASFSEMARRLDRDGGGFLCAGNPRFTADVARLSPATARNPTLCRAVAEAVDRFNVAGLCDPSKRNWYGVNLEDAVRGAHKLGATELAVERLVRAMTARRGSEARS